MQKLFKKQPYQAEKSKITNERQYLIKEFLDELNKSRDGVKYKKLTPSFLGVKLSAMNLAELKEFLNDCKGAKNFSSYFWWKFKI